MATDVTTVVISKETEASLLTYARLAQDQLLSTWQIRNFMLMIDAAYMREVDSTNEQLKALVANLSGNPKKYQDIVVPIIMPQVEAALGYMTNVYLTGNPIFGVTSDPSMIDAALQMETIIGENSIRATWARELMLFFRDGLKYNLHAMECEWEQRTSYTVETDATYPNSAKPKNVLWQGNVLRRMNLYNTYFDPRVSPAKIHEEGEYAGYLQLMSRVRMKQWMNELFKKVPYNTIRRAFESSPGASSWTSGAPGLFYQPQINPLALMNNNTGMTFDWSAWFAGGNNKNRNEIRYNNIYQINKLYARIIPRDFGLQVPEENTPQVWKIWTVNNSVVLMAERLTNAHNWIPMFFGQPMEDGLDYQTKSFAQNVAPMQSIASAMWNGYIASKRRLVTDRVLYDPLRISAKAIGSEDPAAKIPVRPNSFNKPVSEAVYQFPFHDEQADSLLNGATLVQRFADLINGQNAAQQGQFVKGNKTLHEYEDVMGHGNVRNQSMAMMTEFQVFVPMKEAIKLNILQYQPDAVMFNSGKAQNVTIDSVGLRKAAVHFKVSDGIQPIDKLMNGEEWTSALQAVSTSPAIGGAFNVAPMFSYLMKSRGVDLSPFEKSPLQIAFEQAQASWQQVAMQALKAGQPAPPQPVMPPELVAELQQKQKTGGVNVPATSSALEATQGQGEG